MDSGDGFRDSAVRRAIERLTDVTCRICGRTMSKAFTLPEGAGSHICQDANACEAQRRFGRDRSAEPAQSRGTLLSFQTKDQRARREGMRRFVAWKRQAHAHNTRKLRNAP